VKKLRYFFETLLVRGMERLIPRMPRHVLLSFARFAGTLAWLADASGRTTAMENLRVAYRGTLSHQEKRRIVRGAYQNFARTFADLFWASRLTDDNWPQFIIHEMADPAAIELAKKQGAVWVTAHCGNFEWASISWGLQRVPMTTVAQDFKNPGLTPIFQRMRSHLRHSLIPQQGAVIRLLKVLGRRGHIAMLTDLNMRPSRAATIIDCFGLRTCVTTAHVILAQRLGLMILPAVCLPLPDGRYLTKTFAPIKPTKEDDPRELTQQCWNLFEREIRKQPELWMWMYKHWRYLPGEADDPAYPAYANPSTDFQKMLSGPA
jgi:Kdo2-lipid IVA lauroyltransferase/acyltransferase